MSKLPALTAAAALICLLLGACAVSPQTRRERYLAKGKQYLEKGDTSRAILEFKNAAGVSPNDAEIFYELGVAYQRLQDLRSAVLSFQKAIAINPKHAGAQLRLAELMAAANDKSVLQEAQIRLAKIASASSSVDAMDVLAISEMKLGHPDDAVRTLERSLEQFPGELRTYVLLARTKWGLKDIEGVEAPLKKACEQLPKSAEAHRILGQFYAAVNRLPEAEAELRRAVTLDPKSGPALAALAQIQLAEGNRQEAAKSYRQLAAFPGFHAAYGLFLFRTGAAAEAVREFERAARGNPDERELRSYLIAAYRALGRPADIDRVLAAALKKNPKDFLALEQRAEILLGRGDYRAAEADLNNAARFSPPAAELHYLTAQLHRRRGETLSYRQELAESLRLAPTDLAVRIELASSMMYDKSGSALQVLDAAFQAQKSTVPFLVARNWALYAKGDLTEMRKGIDAGLAVARSPELLVQDGLWKLRAGDSAAAQAPLEAALKVAPADVLALQLLNQSYVARNSATQGLAKAKEYAARAPQSAPIQIFLGELLLKSGDLKQARSSFLAAKSADPKASEPDLALIKVDYRERNLEGARAKLEAFLSANPGNPTALLWLGIVAEARGDREAAIGYYRQAVVSNPEDPEANNNLAYLLAESGGDLGEALKFAQHAAELAPQSPAYADTLGWILYRQGLYLSAVKYFEQATANPGDVRWKYHLAMAYAKTGDYKRSHGALSAALQVNPNLPEATLALQVVQGSH